MPTDDERREVARRMRSFVTDDSVYADVDACRVLHSIGLYYKDIDRIYFSGFDVARLADLIEPEPERTCRIIEDGCGLAHCSECGFEFDPYDCSGIPEEGVPYEYDGRYCKNCGAKVVDE